MINGSEPARNRKQYKTKEKVILNAPLGMQILALGGQKVTGPTRVQNDETELQADALHVPATWRNRRVTKAASSAAFKYSQCVTILICS